MTRLFLLKDSNSATTRLLFQSAIGIWLKAPHTQYVTLLIVGVVLLLLIGLAEKKGVEIIDV